MARRKKRISCLGALLILCMLLIVLCTAVVNLLFSGGKAPKLMNNRYCYYTEGDMGSRVPAGSLVIVDESASLNQNDIILYQDEKEAYRVAVASLIIDTSATNPDQSGKTYYLTTEANTTAIEVEEDAVRGLCVRRSNELGAIIGFLISGIGRIIGLVLPLIILIVYLIAILVKSRKAENESLEMEDEDNDLAFVKSIQQKQQRIAERDAERMERERRKMQTFDDGMYEDTDRPAARPQHRLSEEEIARMEEEEAARRAERIAAVRSHMEQRRQTETPDGVPLYTTEIITKTHTLSIPRIGDKPLTTTQQRPLKPTPTEDIPRLTATGHIQIPTAEQVAAEKREQENRLMQAQALARAAQDEAFGTPYRRRYAEEEPQREEPRRYAAPVEERPAQPAPAAPAPAAEPAAPVTPAAAEPTKKVVRKVVKKVVKKPQIASSDFNDLMAFLDNEQKKL